MADRGPRADRLGAVSYETDRKPRLGRECPSTRLPLSPPPGNCAYFFRSFTSDAASIPVHLQCRNVWKAP